jgi:hypothetical protein
MRMSIWLCILMVNRTVSDDDIPEAYVITGHTASVSEGRSEGAFLRREQDTCRLMTFYAGLKLLGYLGQKTKSRIYDHTFLWISGMIK